MSFLFSLDGAGNFITWPTRGVHILSDNGERFLVSLMHQLPESESYPCTIALRRKMQNDAARPLVSCLLCMERR